MSSDYKVIINADDLGYDFDINKAIYNSFQSCLITRASLMVNMPGFEDAVHLLHTHSFLSDKIGLHLNLTEGVPLSDPIRHCKRFCDESGQFIFKRQQPLFFLSLPERTAVYAEMKAQLEKARRSGIRLSHLDSHHHVHTEWAIMKLTIRLGREYGIRQIRLTRNMGNRQGYSKTIYKKFLNSYLKHVAGIAGVDHFGDIDDFRTFMLTSPPKGKSFEIMVHPMLDKKQDLVDIDRKGLKEKLGLLIDHSYTITQTDL